ncbi:NADH-quinone oxidoreductase subunit NuoI [Buchnera aphidicola (Mindarus keteleerifoliae)]
MKKSIKNIFSQFRSIWVVLKNIFSKRETKLYPEEKIKLSFRYRGKIVLTKTEQGEERCVACNLCATVCPVDCISLQKKVNKKNKRWYAKFFRINFSRCIFCGLCEEACPTAAIQLTPNFELSEFKRKNLIYEKKDLLISTSGKYPDYDFYNYTGVSIKGKFKGELKNESKPIKSTTLLP